MKGLPYIQVAVALLSFFHGFSQCGTADPLTTTNYCANQTAAWSYANSSPSNTTYKWYQYISSAYQNVGTGDYYETTQTFPNGYGTVNTYYYEKEIDQTPSPALPAPLPTVGGNVSGSVSLNYTSTTDFVLNYVTVAVHANWTGSPSTYALKVSANGQYSQWYTFKYSDAIAVSSSTLYFKVPVYTSATQLGLSIPSGNSAITISTCSGADPCPSGASAVDGFEFMSPSVLSPTYTMGATTLNYTTSQQNVWGSNSIPGIFEVDITTKCGKTLVTAIQETDNSKCCTPVASYSTITSSTGSNIYDTIFPSGVTLTASGNSAALYYIWYRNGVEMGASYKGYGVTNIPISTYGIYTVKVVQSPVYANRAVCYKTTPYDAQERVLFAIANPKTICLGSTGTLVAKGATSNISWTTTSGVAISNSTSQVASITPSAVGKYLFNVQADVPIGNLVVNGDFESGNTGFSSTYLYKDPSNAVDLTPAEAWATGYPTRKSMNLGNGAYTINDYVFWPGWNGWDNCKGRGGVGKFLYTDAATTAGNYIWEQTVNVEAGKTYEFSAWVTNIDTNGVINPSGNPLPQANIFINGTPLFSPVIPISASTCLWQKVSQTWVATTTGPITLRVDEVSKVNHGNDFAIDDISFGTPGTQTDTVSVTVTDCTPLPVNFLFADLIKKERGVEIIWQTADEQNAAVYIVERSNDGGKTFFQLGTVNAKNRRDLNSYAFLEEGRISGTVYFRIHEIDQDGASQYSELLSASEGNYDLIIMPNPSQSAFTITKTGNDIQRILIYNLKGQVVAEYTNLNALTVEVGAELTSGVYVVEIYSENEVEKYRLIKE